ncbi:very short patch repair endonuclease [Rhodovulum viride]|uniref:Very short patch repair endonuclease n=2 Tax=Rhodovulum viride TaxID=1231134 RepID=A0ABX9DDJ2_9RHOB|nr:very short patch repair endonuclease [Rhodovulum viride]
MSRSEMMSRIGPRNTTPEMKLRRGLHRAGFRFRLHRKDLPGKPDITLPRHRAVIRVQGCFWHMHPGCKNFRIPKSNTAFWEEKIARNVARDAEQAQALNQLGWRVLTVWECATRTMHAEDLTAVVAEWLLGSAESGEIPETVSAAQTEEGMSG